MQHGLRHEGEKVIIEMLPVSVVSRLVLGSISLVFLLLGLLGCYQIAQMALGYRDSTGNTMAGIFVTITVIVISIPGIWVSVDSGKTLCLDPGTRQALLTKRYLFKSVEKRFPFGSLEPCFVTQDSDLESIWRVNIKLPDNTRIEGSDATSINLKNSSEMWRNKINAMIGKF